MPEDMDAIAQYFKSMHQVTTDMSREEMHELWKRAKRGDKKAKKRIMEQNLRLVIPTAKKYHRPGTELMDLIEEGNLGLLHAIDKFDPKKGFRFSTYATYWIEQYIRRAVEQQLGTIRIPPHAWEGLRQWIKQWDILHGQLGREPTLTEMAKAMHWSARQIKGVMEASEAAKGIGSLAMPIDGTDEEVTLEDTIVDPQGNSPDNLLSVLKLRDDFGDALKQIGDREKQILECRYGLSGREPMTLEEIGKKLKLSRERVRQIEERAILRLRRTAQRMGLVDFNDMKSKTPNFHPGNMEVRGPTNILGEPVGKHPMKLWLRAGGAGKIKKSAKRGHR